MDKISSLYHNSELAEETRSIKIEDLERVLGDMTIEYPKEGEIKKGVVYFTDDESKTPIGETTRYSSYTYKEGDYKFVNPPIKAIAGEKIDVTSWMFMVTKDDGETRADYVPEVVYDMLFDGTTVNSKIAKSYWIASPKVHIYQGVISYGPGIVYYGRVVAGGDLFHSNGKWYSNGFAVRPVVKLKSNITLKQVNKIDSQTEEEWTTEGGLSYGEGNLNQ